MVNSYKSLGKLIQIFRFKKNLIPTLIFKLFKSRIISFQHKKALVANWI
jgi:hypothetical protein